MFIFKSIFKGIAYKETCLYIHVLKSKLYAFLIKNFYWSILDVQSKVQVSIIVIHNFKKVILHL